MTKLQELAGKWNKAKELENEIKAHRQEIEKEIKAQPDYAQSIEAKAVGKRNLFETLAFSVSENRSWDQSLVAEFAKNCPPEKFPFKIEFKEDRKKMQTLAEQDQELYAAIIPALSVSYRAPSFSAVKPKD